MTNTNLLKAKIAERGLTQEKVAVSIGISNTSMTNKVNNYRGFTVTEIAKLCELLKIDNKDTYFFAC